jgi:hypothetical protein
MAGKADERSSDSGGRSLRRVPAAIRAGGGGRALAGRRHAVVLLLTNDPPSAYPYEVVCEATADGWDERMGGNGPGWTSTTEEGATENLGVFTLWGPAPPGAVVVVVRFRERDHEVPVRDGYYLFAAWDVAAGETEGPLLSG